MVYGDRFNDRRNRPNLDQNGSRRDSNARRTALNGMSFEEASTALSPNGGAAMAQLAGLKRGRTIAVADVIASTKISKKYAGEHDEAKELGTKTWARIADVLGLHYDMVKAFNPEIKMTPAGLAEEGQRFYVPTPSEVLFWQVCATESKTVTAVDVRNDPAMAIGKSPKGVARFKSMVAEGRLTIVESARDRAAGETGDAYAKFSGAFYTPNEDLSTQATANVDGKSEKVARWGAYWKCNVFVNDTMDQAEQKTPVMGNKHYATAGSMWTRFTTKKGGQATAEHLYDEVSYGDIQAGDIFVRYGGTGEASSHTEVITHKAGPHVFYAHGAHFGGAFERRYVTDDAKFSEASKQLLVELAASQGRSVQDMSPEEWEEYEHQNVGTLTDQAHVSQLDLEDYRFLRLKSLKP
jgi:hypothetical protein